MEIAAEDVEIVGLGAQGDGIARTASGPRYVPFALPGELWRSGAGGGDVLLRAHPARATPICRHFGACGGCVAQHMPEETYTDWKRQMVVAALRHRGIDAPVAPLWSIPPASRRRVTLHARRDGGDVRLGFHRAAAHEVMDISECPIAVPQIVAALPALRTMLDPLLARQAEAAVTVVATAAGLDVHLAFTNLARPASHYPRLAALGARHGFARLAVGGDVLLQAGRPTLTFAGIGVEPPPAAFVQAVEAAQQKMTGLVLAAVGAPKRVADLFCGIGTFTFPLAHHAGVLAVDGSAAAIAALGAAARHGRGLKPIEARVRDLFREPLAGKELEAFDAVVFDPPRSGAKAQAAQLARARVPVVVAVSCDPGTLARDVRLLVDGGYDIDRVTPIDQFLFSAHVEVVAVLRRRR